MLKPVVKSAALILWIILWYPPIWLAKRFNKIELWNRMLQKSSKGMLYIAGVHLQTTGEYSLERPMLLVSNHISYLDVLILSSVMPVRFTPKSEIAKWPVIGDISRLCGAVFIDRRPSMIGKMREQLKAALLEGKIISLFPEATTGDGIHMLPFKAGFFSLAEEDFGEKGLVIQPAAITYTKIRKLPIDRTQWPDIAWYGDMDLMPHLMHVFSLGPVDAEVIFLPPIHVTKDDNRKDLAMRCQQSIEEAIEQVRSRQPKHLKAHLPVQGNDAVQDNGD